MTLHTAISQGFFTGLRQWRIGAIVYVLQLALALTVGMQVQGVFEASIGNSLEINKLMAGYDHTVITDFLKTHGASITPLIGQLRWMLLIWLFVSVFLDAGLLVCALRYERPRALDFWAAAAAYFWPFLKIFFVFLLFLLLWSALIWLPVLTYLQPALQYFVTEQYAVWGVVLALLLYLLGLFFGFVWSVLSRIYAVKNEAMPWRSIRGGWRALAQHKRRYIGLILFFLSVQAAIFGLYWAAESVWGMVTPVLILVFFLIQQAVAFSRILLRQMVYAGLGRFF